MLVLRITPTVKVKKAVVLGQGKKKKAIPKIKETTKTVLKKKHGLPVILKKKISHYAKKVLKSFGGLKEVP